MHLTIRGYRKFTLRFNFENAERYATKERLWKN